MASNTINNIIYSASGTPVVQSAQTESPAFIAPPRRRTGNEARFAVLEARIDAYERGNRRVDDKIVTDPQQSALLRTFYNNVCSYNSILNQFRLEDILIYGLPDTDQLGATQASVLITRIRTHMENKRRRFRRNQRQTAAEIQQAVVSNIRSRMDTIMEETLRISSRDCQAVLDTAYMSEGKNDAVNEHGLATSLIKLSHSWRSTKTKLYAFLDAPAGPSRGISLPRTTRVVESLLTTTQRARLPRWAISSEKNTS
ncbi:hypothetical protein INT47_009025 [Mucor saturninus]|uniref:Uncharacterized protein n=1 Tax=Mucor saturninus TaxID=64648 RepID=A0A8H7QG25_9FUNG|nr:hypothetical protein INT47_009025 [Mucor saturninus]